MLVQHTPLKRSARHGLDGGWVRGGGGGGSGVGALGHLPRCTARRWRTRVLSGRRPQRAASTPADGGGNPHAGAPPLVTTPAGHARRCTMMTEWGVPADWHAPPRPTPSPFAFSHNGLGQERPMGRRRMVHGRTSRGQWGDVGKWWEGAMRRRRSRPGRVNGATSVKGGKEQWGDAAWLTALAPTAVNGSTSRDQRGVG